MIIASFMSIDCINGTGGLVLVLVVFVLGVSVSTSMSISIRILSIGAIVENGQRSASWPCRLITCGPMHGQCPCFVFRASTNTLQRRIMHDECAGSTPAGE